MVEQVEMGMPELEKKEKKTLDTMFLGGAITGGLIAIGGAMLGYKAGQALTLHKIQIGLERCFKVDSTLEPSIWAAIGKIRK